MVVIHVKFQGGEDQFLYETTGDTSNDTLLRELVDINNTRVRIAYLCGAMAELAEHGPSKPHGEEGIDHIQQLNGILEEIDSQRDAVIALHQHIRNRISAGVDSDFEHYEQRTMVHSLIEAPERKLDLSDLRRELQLGQSEMASLMDEVRNRRERQLSDRAGQIIAVPNNSNLRFWLGSLPRKKK